MDPVTLFCAAIPEAGETTVLDTRESHHAIRVRRSRTGDSVRLIDGCGVIAEGVIIAARNSEARVEIRARRVQPAHACQIHVAAALPKGDRQATLVDMLTQLGVSSFTPLECAHSVVRAGKSAAARWHRVCVEACKQSGNAYVPELRDSASPVQAVAGLRAQSAACFLAHPGAESTPPRYPVSGPVGLLIGPEGGFTDSEVRAAQRAGAVATALGPYMLRIETAAVAWAGAVRLHGARRREED